MKAVLSLLLVCSMVYGQTEMPTCPDMECPDSKPEGGLFARADCSNEFCSCSYGTHFSFSF